MTFERFMEYSLNTRKCWDEITVNVLLEFKNQNK